MKAIAVTEPNRLKIVEIPKPTPGPYDAIIRTEVAFICNLTDRKIVEGHMPGLSRENYPLLLGHESVGTVVEVGNKVTTFKPGDRAIGGLLLESTSPDFHSGWGGNCEFTVIRDHEAMERDGVADERNGWNEVYKIMTKVPADLPIEAAGLLCTWREVLSGLLHDFKLTRSDEVLIFGAGPVGLSFAAFLKLLGAPYVAIVDPHQNKRDLAIRLGADAVFDRQGSMTDVTASRGGRKLDAVVDAVGRESIINMALPLIKPAGRICIYGVVGSDTITLQHQSGPYNFNLLFHQWPTRDAERDAQAQIIEWVQSGKLDPQLFVTSRFSFSRFSDAYGETKKASNIKTMVLY